MLDDVEPCQPRIDALANAGKYRPMLVEVSPLAKAFLRGVEDEFEFSMVVARAWRVVRRPALSTATPRQQQARRA